MNAGVLIVDDEKNIRRTLTLVLEGAGYSVREAASGDEALERLAEAPAALALLDVSMPGIDGIQLLGRLRDLHPDLAVVMISGNATIDTAVEATRLGALDFLEKPLSRDRVLVAVRNALRLSDLDAQARQIRDASARRHRVVGDSPALRVLLDQVSRVARTPATVLLTGESGTGKEVIARVLHEDSPRREGPFVKVNCAAIPETLIESELFGCVKGAYTGADRARDGRFQQADRGTLFLDEIADMSLAAQAKVLRALQEGEVERVGGDKPDKVDVRVVAATNRDLGGEVARGRFREDLFYRLNVIPLRVPPLRERVEDVPRLAEHFLALYAAENDLPAKRLSPEAGAALRAMSWRGNVRELRNVIERLAILGSGAVIGEEEVRTLAAFGALGPAPAAPPAAAASGAGKGPIATTLDAVRAAGGLVAARREFERAVIELGLDATGGNVSQTAQLLMIERSNLHKKLQALGLEARPSRPDASHPEEESP